jgi:hypothetical protein
MGAAGHKWVHCFLCPRPAVLHKRFLPTYFSIALHGIFRSPVVQVMYSAICK